MTPILNHTVYIYELIHLQSAYLNYCSDSRSVYSFYKKSVKSCKIELICLNGTSMILITSGEYYSERHFLVQFNFKSVGEAESDKRYFNYHFSRMPQLTKIHKKY